MAGSTLRQHTQGSRRDLSVLKHCKNGSTTSSTTMRLTISKRQLMKRDLQEGSPSQ